MEMRYKPISNSFGVNIMSVLGKIKTKIVDVVFPVKTETITDYPTAMPDHKSPNYPAAFQTDGCSGGMSWAWRKFIHGLPPWENCCVKHDLAYWRGGFWKDRKEADRKLAACVRRHGHPVWATLMYIGVRLGGSPFWPLPWRWGYGWKYTARYEKRWLTEKLNSYSLKDL